MKKTTIVIIISIFVFSFACKKDSKIEDIVTPTASMKCKINGVAWSAAIRATTLQSNKFIINGTGSLGSDVINVTIFGITTGTYNLDPINSQTQFSASYTIDTQTTDSIYTALNGMVILSTVDTINHKISGTFLFTAGKVINPLLIKEVSEGIFTDLSYQ